ncbi:hexosyltransferase [Elysia marginata]|uniref:Hexosyltransferase n=1 Tax=Elysia marginata TaxID=1093978 RepID=A0AAV4FUA2_9GAST|nr:hexosyltransferase [Elysia marginata]
MLPLVPTFNNLLCFCLFFFSDPTLGCAYILSREAAERVVWLFPFYPRMIIEDAFLTGVLAREAGVQHFSFAHKWYFAEFYTRITDWCSFLRDELISMTGVDSRNQRLSLWASHISNRWQCQTKDMADLTESCWQEFPVP